ncbi:MAG: quinone-dependent dihydroorotate dehydrogenase [Flaviflexus sp.]|nr:quinone-dependent dihydroorotate dehydrogenase [Flaviflexus sp.]
MLYHLLLTRVISRIDPEEAHGRALELIGAMGRSPLAPLVRHTIGRRGAPHRSIFARPIPGLVGLAAGMDKNGEAIEGLDALGFGFIEVGTVTPKPQPGNDQPRMWRHLEIGALRNAMGFNNEGAEALGKRLAKLRSTPAGRKIVIGVNIGKNRTTAPEDAVGDYASCARTLSRFADYLVINVSSPNTPGLRDLLQIDALRPIVRAVRAEADRNTTEHLPVLVKISPDMADEDLPGIAKLVAEENLDGVVATNTTIDHDFGAGGLSGEPLTSRSRSVVRQLRDLLPLDTLIIGVGGVTSIDDARGMLAAGADLVQIYSSFVTRGPLLPGRLNRALIAAK